MTPRVSVIIPTYNRPAALLNCLTALGRQRGLSETFEVIAVNDGGSEPVGISAELAERLQLRILHQENAGPATARNLGVQASRGEFLVFTDDDCEPTETWLSSLLARLDAEPDVMVGGITVNGLREDLCAEASQQLVDFLYQFYVDSGVPRFFTSNNMAMSREGFLALGGFDETFPLAAAEDRDLCMRWRVSGRALRLAPEAVLIHFHHMTLKRFSRQHFNYGRGALQFRARALRLQDRQAKIEPVSFYWNLLTFPWRTGKHGPATRLALQALFGLTQLANAAGVLFEAYRTRRAQPG